MKPYKSKGLKALQTEWYQKLKNEGFEDIENKNGSLKGHGSLSNNEGNPGHKPGYQWGEREIYNNSKQEYYRIAGHFLHDFKFKSEIERYIWELHANGVSMKNIAITIKEFPNRTELTRIDKVFDIIKKLSKEMKRMYFE